LYAVMFDSLNEGVFAVDRHWRIIFFNKAAQRITGVKREEALGKPCCEVFRASICETACALRQTWATGRPVVNKVIYILNSRGERIPISISTAVFKNAQGEILGGVETFRDLRLTEHLRKQAETGIQFAQIVGRSPAMRQMFDLLPQIAQTSTTVLLEGESGTGKELVARAIHQLSPRRNRRFVAVNCAALPDTLLESELFGYKAGAFTDARQDKPGRFALAEGGTLFLDEIGDISPAMQTRLLRFLQERTYEPLGSNEPVQADVRIIAATHRDLWQLVRQGQFREDLFYRIHVVVVRLPPLRERREDIPLLVEHFIDKFNRIQGKEVAGVSEEVLARLMEYDYPGNVRELENIIEHAFVLCRGGLIELAHLPPHLRSRSEEKMQSVLSAGTLREMERCLIVDALRRHGGNRTAAARQLGIHLSTLFRKMRRLKISWPPSSEATEQ
jgi:PAS domain S-box-containing protein